MKFSIVIPTWNGKALIKKNLPQVVSSADQAEIIIVDNGSTDETAVWIKTHYQKDFRIKVIKLAKNFGFAYACNFGVKQAEGEIVVLLNNDVIPEDNFLKPLEKIFQDSKTFAVSLNEPQFSWAKGEFNSGFLSHQPGQKTAFEHISLWASGGSGAFRRSIWEKLGGFDLVYEPFYWEDIDLSYRAWKRGYLVYWEPKSVVHHEHESTVKRFSKKYIDLIKQRNELFFIWKNITSTKLTKNHLKALGKRASKSPGYLKVIFSALPYLLKINRARKQEIAEAKLTDEEIFEKFKN